MSEKRTIVLSEQRSVIVRTDDPLSETEESESGTEDSDSAGENASNNNNEPEEPALEEQPEDTIRRKKATTGYHLFLQANSDWSNRAQQKREDSDLGNLEEGEDETCGKCRKRFSRRKDMRNHTQTCGEHICDVCGAKFGDAIRLGLHAKVHSNPLKCGKCGKEFAKLSGLTRHMKTHENAQTQLYSCELCPEKYRQKYNLQRHMKKKHL